MVPSCVFRTGATPGVTKCGGRDIEQLAQEPFAAATAEEVEAEAAEAEEEEDKVDACNDNSAFVVVSVPMGIVVLASTVCVQKMFVGP